MIATQRNSLWRAVRDSVFGFDAGVSTASPPDSDRRLRAIAGRWYGRSRAATGYPYADWFDPAVEDTLVAAVNDLEFDEPIVQLGMARASHGFTLTDTLTDWSVLLEVLPPHVVARLDESVSTAALVAGFDAVGGGSHTRSRVIADPAELRQELIRTRRRDRSAGSHPGGLHTLVIVDLGPERGDPEHEGIALHAAAMLILDRFPLAGTVASITDRRLAVLVRRHPGLLLAFEHLDAELRIASEIPPCSIWLAPLPAERGTLGSFVSALHGELSECAEHFDAAELAVSGSRVFDDVVSAPQPTGAITRLAIGGRVVRRLRDRDFAASLVAVAVAVALVATSLVRAVDVTRNPGVPQVAAPATPASSTGTDDPEGSASGLGDVGSGLALEGLGRPLDVRSATAKTHAEADVPRAGGSPSRPASSGDGEVDSTVHAASQGEEPADDGRASRSDGRLDGRGAARGLAHGLKNAPPPQARPEKGGPASAQTSPTSRHQTGPIATGAE